MPGLDVNNCWRTVGVAGDRSCPELARHVHCRNCPVYTAAAQALLDRPVPTADLAERAAHLAAPQPLDARGGTEPVMVFRVNAEWLAVPAHVVREVAETRPVHAIPHRRGGPLLGIANVRGELVPCVSLSRLLGAETAPVDPAPCRSRLIVLSRGATRVVCHADEVHGVHRVRTADFRDVPATVRKAGGRHARAVFSWQDLTVGLLDEDLLFNSVQRSLM